MFLIASFLLLILISVQAGGPPQHQTVQGNQAAPAKAAGPDDSQPLIIPAGTKVPLSLKQAVSTKNAHEGDAIYCQTTFPIVQDNRVLIPAGTYVQGKIAHIQRAGRVKGRAELLMHFTTMIYPNGYTVVLPASVENIPGADTTSMKGSEGTVRQDSDAGKKARTVAGTAVTGAAIGGISGEGKGALIGAGAGGAVGTAIALLTRGSDVKLENGSSIEMVIQRPVSVDPNRIQAAR
jgi:type IV secretion system protein VirB10